MSAYVLYKIDFFFFKHYLGSANLYFFQIQAGWLLSQTVCVWKTKRPTLILFTVLHKLTGAVGLILKNENLSLFFFSWLKNGSITLVPLRRTAVCLLTCWISLSLLWSPRSQNTKIGCCCCFFCLFFSLLSTVDCLRVKTNQKKKDCVLWKSALQKIKM